MTRIPGTMIGDLFAPVSDGGASAVTLADDTLLLRGFAGRAAPALLAAIDGVAASAPFRHMSTPNGFHMSVAMTNCGAAGWVTDRKGYRYTAVDPVSDVPWPPMPEALRVLARRAAASAGFGRFEPDACLVNRYEPGARLSLHQDRDERDYSAPIVSVSLGLPVVFLLGGARRADRPRRIGLEHGDVVVWGRRARLVYHGVAPLPDGDHPLTGRCRINLTFRKAL